MRAQAIVENIPMVGIIRPALEDLIIAIINLFLNSPFSESLMEVMEAILTRRSIRRYTDEPVTRKQIEDLLRAAMAAPSAGNEQPWQFVVIDDPNILKAVPEFHPYSRMLTRAKAAVLVCGDMTLEKFKGYWVQDCSAAAQNILLAAHGLGLGAVWLGIYPQEERVEGMRRLIGLPEHVVPLCLVSVGRPGEEKTPADRFDPSRIRYNKW